MIPYQEPFVEAYEPFIMDVEDYLTKNLDMKIEPDIFEKILDLGLENDFDDDVSALAQKQYNANYVSDKVDSDGEYLLKDEYEKDVEKIPEFAGKNRDLNISRKYSAIYTKKYYPKNYNVKLAMEASFLMYFGVIKDPAPWVKLYQKYLDKIHSKRGVLIGKKFGI